MRFDFRFAFRSLCRHKALSAVVVVTLALAIGANTALFSLMDALLLRDLPVRDPQHLFLLHWQARQWPGYDSMMEYGDCESSMGMNATSSGCDYSYAYFDSLRQHAADRLRVAAYGGYQGYNLTGAGAAAEMQAEPVSGGFFDLLGLRPAAGRLLGPSDDTPVAPVSVVLSYRFWQSHFGGERSAIGRTVALNQVPATIVGVAAPGFAGLAPGSDSDGWVPLHALPRISTRWHASQWGPASSWLVLLARLRPGVGLAAGQAEAEGLFRNAMLTGAKPLLKAADNPQLALLPAQSAMRGAREQFEQPLTVLVGAAAAILLLACANIAGLLLGRSSARQREFALRRAVGAGTGRIVRQLLAESLLLAGAGGALGVLLALFGDRALVAALMGAHRTLHLEAPMSVPVLLFALAATLATGVLFGLAPGLRGARADLSLALKESAGSTPRHRGFLGGSLVVAQVGLCVLVLAGAGLLARTFANARAIRAGFDTRNLLLFGVGPNSAGYKGDAVTRYYARLREGIAALPGVRSVSYANFAPIGGGMMAGGFQIGTDPKAKSHDANKQDVGPGYFSTVGIPLLAGRAFDARDFEPSPPVPHAVVVNRTLVQRFLHGNPLGQMLGPRQIIVGVVGDARYARLERPIGPMLYRPATEGYANFTVRTAGDPMLLLSAVRRVLAGIDPTLPLLRPTTQTRAIADQLFQERMLAELAGAAAGLALLLAALGLYALLAQEVGRRTREIGIRMALGAERRRVLRMILVRGAGLAALGLALGTAGAMALTRYLKSLLYGVQPGDPATLAAVAAILFAVAVVASLLPSRRAASVDPLVALREE